MSKDINQKRVFEEGVIITLGDDMTPTLCIRKANGDGKISIYKMTLVGFEDIRKELSELAEAPLIHIKHNGAIPSIWKIPEHIKAGDTVELVEEDGAYVMKITA